MTRSAIAREGGLLYTQLARHDGYPARFSAPLANTARTVEHYSSQHPPRALFEARLARGDYAVIDELRTALQTITNDEDAETVAQHYAHALAARSGTWTQERTPVRPIIDGLIRLVTDPSIPLVARDHLARQFADHSMTVCTPELDALFSSARVSDAACVAYFGRTGAPEAVPVARIAAYAKLCLGDPLSLSLNHAAFALVRAGSPEAIVVLREMLSDPSCTPMLETVLSTLYPDVYAKAIAGIERKSREPQDGDDDPRDPEAAAGDDAGTGKPDGEPFDENLILVRECRDPHQSTDAREKAFEQLAERDFSRAVEVARSLHMEDERDRAVAARVPLARFPEPGQLRDHMRSLGLLLPPVGDGVELLSPASIAEAFYHYGHATEVLVESTHPVGHDSSMEAIALMTSGSVLHDAVFEEVPPIDTTTESYDPELDPPPERIDPDQLQNDYVVRAFVANRSYEIVCGSGRRVDVEALVGFANALCRDLGSSQRFAILPRDEYARIVTAPLEAFGRGFADGLLAHVATDTHHDLGDAS